MEPLSAELEIQIEALYAAFAAEPVPASVQGCTNCCTSEDELAGLLAAPLRELSAEALGAYASNACDTVGAEADFKYFLPRLFELAAAEAWGFPDGAWVIRRLKQMPSWTDWPSAEQAAIRGFLLAWWGQALSQAKGFGYDEFDDALATLLTIDPAGADRYFETWLKAGPDAVLRLARFVIDHLLMMQAGHEWNSWATLTGTELLSNWLAGPDTTAALSDAMEAETELERLELISDAWVLMGQ